MAITRRRKEQIYNELKDSIASQKAILVLTTKGSEVSLSSELSTAFRKDSRKSGIVIQVIKNTLVNKVFDSLPKLDGQTYIAYLEKNLESDEIKVPKGVVGLVDSEYKDKFQVVGSIINGEFYDSARTHQLSKTPSLEESMSMVAGSINQLSTMMAVSIKEIPASVGRGVCEIQKTIS
ncbi:MAG: 50S ribosomal protein L10 [Patescibacteria group bacterium]